MSFKVNKTVITLVQGDITEQDTGAIVNAANSSLLGGGGVDGAIHRAGGPQILEECRQIRAARGGCPAGEAVITTGGRLKAAYVIHTVGPIWSGGGSGEDHLLACAYRSSLGLAAGKGIKTIAFPSISTGAYRFPTGRAARVSAEAVKNFLENDCSLEEVRFVLFSRKDFDIYRRAWEELLGQPSE